MSGYTKNDIEVLGGEIERLKAINADLLAALKSLVVNDGRISGVNLGALKRAVDAAIAKAEGVS